MLSYNPIVGPIPPDFEKYITSVPDALELIPDVLYSTKTYTSATTRTLTFFDTAVVAGDYSVTNMTQGGSLPNPQSFLIEFPQIFFKTSVQSDNSGTGNNGAITSSFSDVVELCKAGWVTLQINNKNYGPWPMWKWVLNSFVKGAFASGSDLLADYGQLDGALYPFLPKLSLLPLQPFVVQMNWATPPATSTATVDIMVLFDGKRARAIG